MLNKFDWLHIRQLSLANSARKLPGSSLAGLFCETYSRSKWRLHGVSVHVCWWHGFQGVSRGWHTSIQRSNVLGSPHERWIALFNCQLARWSRIWLVAGTYQEVVERNVDLSWSDEAFQWAKAWEMTDSIESLAVLIASFFGASCKSSEDWGSETQPGVEWDCSSGVFSRILMAGWSVEEAVGCQAAPQERHAIATIAYLFYSWWQPAQSFNGFWPRINPASVTT